MKKLLAMLLALMMVLSVLTVAVFAQGIGGDEDPDDMGVTDTTPEPTPDNNPHTGIALAALPVVISAAAVAVSKKH